MFLLQFTSITNFVTASDIGKRVCVGKYTIPFDGKEVHEQFYTPLDCQNCNESADFMTLANNGEQLLIHLGYNDETKIPKLRRGPLEGKGHFRFQFMYFNFRPHMPEEWGLNNVSFPAELHLVFYSDKFSDYEKALEKDNGIAVASMAFRVRTQSTSPFLGRIIEDMVDVRGIDTNTTVPLKTKLTLSTFMPQSYKYYYTYVGTMLSTRSPTLTTCQSNVIWIDFDEAHKIHPDDIREFELLRSFLKFSITKFTLNYKSPETKIMVPLKPKTTTAPAAFSDLKRVVSAVPNGQKKESLIEAMLLICLAIILERYYKF
ncbi:carbonic anhydrase 7-like [Musca domestica]|uniref:Carbonic anhydrase 7-like n=1 Tax=Musca domestica TaxID=7370 RepID=A0ABM3ULH9_MUSDO|nr:carbonic anhydrase 7-like [Musca domestica]